MVRYKNRHFGDLATVRSPEKLLLCNAPKIHKKVQFEAKIRKKVQFLEIATKARNQNIFLDIFSLTERGHLKRACRKVIGKKFQKMLIKAFEVIVQPLLHTRYTHFLIALFFHFYPTVPPPSRHSFHSKFRSIRSVYQENWTNNPISFC